MKKNPVILITSEQNYASAGMRYAPVYSLNKAYAHAVSAAGGFPITPLGPCMETEYCEMADGLLLTGGNSQIHPGRYMTPFVSDEAGVRVNVFRDTMEFDLFEAFLKAGKPIMGICRGNLLINVALGGTLIQDLYLIKGLRHSDGSSHTVTAEPGSILENLVGNEFNVNTYHNQAIDMLGDGLKVTAYSSDGVIEALEHETKPIFSVQFHPEMMQGEGTAHSNGPDMLDLFAYFIKLCR